MQLTNIFKYLQPLMNFNLEPDIFNTYPINELKFSTPDGQKLLRQMTPQRLP